MEAIILAGGFGKRLGKITNDIPKPMVHIGGVPFLEIILKNLKKKGFKKIIISTFYKGEIISDYFGENYLDMKIIYAKEKFPLGTGGAVKYALNFTSEVVDHVYIFNGDTFLNIDIDLIEKEWEKYKKPLVIGVKVDSCKRYGSLLLKNNYVIGFNEKNSEGSGIINAGCYIFPKNIMDEWESGRNFSLENNFFNKKLINEKILFFLHKGLFIDIGIPTDYEKAKVLLKNYAK